MEIRRYQPADEAQVVALWHIIFPPTAPHHDPNLSLTRKLAVDDLLFVAESDGRIVGTCMAGYDGHRGWLYSVAVDQAYRRQGIGRRLVVHAIEGLKALGCPKVNLQVMPTNRDVEAFYASIGFKIEERISMGFRLYE